MPARTGMLFHIPLSQNDFTTQPQCVSMRSQTSMPHLSLPFFFFFEKCCFIFSFLRKKKKTILPSTCQTTFLGQSSTPQLETSISSQKQLSSLPPKGPLQKNTLSSPPIKLFLELFKATNLPKKSLFSMKEDPFHLNK